MSDTVVVTEGDTVEIDVVESDDVVTIDVTEDTTPDVVQVSPERAVTIGISEQEPVQVTVPAEITPSVNVFAGLQGPQGPPGPIGGFVHNQSTPAEVWTIVHNLGVFPAVTVVDSSGRQVEGDVAYVNENTITVTFAAAFSGIAYLS